MKRLSIALIAGLSLTSAAGAATLQTVGLSGGTAVDFSGLTASTPGSITPINTSDSAFTNAGIASITVDDRPSSNNEFYNPGSTFGAGDALFNTEDGELILVEEGTTLDFGSPTFTIAFAGLVDGFGFRIADTSSSFINPLVVQVFAGGTELLNEAFTGLYDASTEFSITDSLGFDRVVIGPDGIDADGYGISSLTVGSSVTIDPIPLPAGAWLLLTGLGALGLGRRFRRT
ncbi:MAG: VPLPA-CTERM sorting domain-containing protein [Pseudomonadota bacterium]